jgi:hypothetical protein
MNALIIYPEFPKTFWSFTNFLKTVSNKPVLAPKELLKTSILLPITWERKLIDLNSEKLKKSDILWADYIFISAKEEQIKSTFKFIERCKLLGKKIVGTGSLFNDIFEEFEQVDNLILDDMRITLPLFINDIENKKTKKIYHSNPFFEIRKFTESYYSLTSFSDSFPQNIQMSFA